jgi:hypothetical protein
MAKSFIKRPPTSEAQKELLRQKQLAYIASDPRWVDHRRKLSEAQQKPDQRQRLSVAQLSYMQRDPRWPDHRARMQEAALEATKLSLLPEEIETIIALRHIGRTFEYIAEELCVSDKIIRRELKALDIPTSRVSPRPKANRGKGYWRSFDDAHPVTL